MLFAVYPVNVQSVAWISQRKNLLALLFSLLSVQSYLKSDPLAGSNAREQFRQTAGTLGLYLLSLIAFVLALLSKISIASLPLILLLLHWWRQGRVTKQALLRTAPFFAAAVALVAVNFWFQGRQYADGIRDAGVTERLLGAGAIIWFYLGKAILPLNLIFVYPNWDIRVGDWTWWLPLLGACAVTGFLIARRNRTLTRPVLFAWLFFCIGLLSVLGIVDTGLMRHTLVADHYQHVALIGPVALFAAGMWHWRERYPITASSFALAIAGTLMVLTARQNALYADRINPLRGNDIEKSKRVGDPQQPGQRAGGTRKLQGGIEHLMIAVQINPEFAEARNNLAALLIDSGARTGFQSNELAKAIDHLKVALETRPEYTNAHINLGRALMHANRLADAKGHCETALKLSPGHPEALYGMGAVLSQERDWPTAESFFHRALRANPRSVRAHYAVANALAAQQKYQRAVEHYKTVIELKPDQFAKLCRISAHA